MRIRAGLARVREKLGGPGASRRAAEAILKVRQVEGGDAARPTIEYRDVSFKRQGSVPVLDHFSLTVETGDVLALVGRSGAGKTTLLKLVNRLLLPDAGAVLVEGRDTREWEPIALRRRVGYVLQDVGLFPHMTVADNVARRAPPRAAGTPERVTARVHELLDLIGLPAEQFASRWPDELSGGQRQRVGVARALALDPPVLLMDEPFGALDPLTRAELHAEFHRIQQRLRKTVIIVTHDMGEAFALGDEARRARRGRARRVRPPRGDRGVAAIRACAACSMRCRRSRGRDRDDDDQRRARRTRRASYLRSLRLCVERGRMMSRLFTFWLSHRAELAVPAGAARAAGRRVHVRRGRDWRAARHIRGTAPASGRAARRPRQRRADDAEPRDVRLPAAGAARRRRRRARRASSC